MAPAMQETTRNAWLLRNNYVHMRDNVFWMPWNPCTIQVILKTYCWIVSLSDILTFIIRIVNFVRFLDFVWCFFFFRYYYYYISLFFFGFISGAPWGAILAILAPREHRTIFMKSRISRTRSGYADLGFFGLSKYIKA